MSVSNLPAIITAVTALIVAVTGLISAVRAHGRITAGQSSPPPDVPSSQGSPPGGSR